MDVLVRVSMGAEKNERSISQMITEESYSRDELNSKSRDTARGEQQGSIRI